MTQSQKRMNLLVIEDDKDMGGVICDLASQVLCQAQLACNWDEARKSLNNHVFDIVFSDIHMPGMSGLDFLELWKEKKSPSIPWIFISGDGSPETIERAMKAGALDIMQKPVRKSDIAGVLERLHRAHENPLLPIMHSIQNISGVRLGDDKRLLVETRIMRRARALGMASLEQYIEFFGKNSQQEVPELISILTTHTTSFFREIDHFHYLEKEVLSKLKRGDQLRMWSAACSSGEEVYTLGICAVEALRKLGLENQVRIEIVGTDIDFNAVETAAEGIYAFDTVSRLPKDILDRYFEHAVQGGQSWVRVIDEIHRLCSFRQQNLLSASYQVDGQFDLIFLRNVLIYFGTREIEHVMERLKAHVRPEGLLFLGHSESITSLTTAFSFLSNSIYKLSDPLNHRYPESQGASFPVVKGLPSLEHVSSNAMPNTSHQEVGKIIVIDDSPVVRKMLRAILSLEHGFDVVGEANHPLEAEVLLQKYQDIDAVTLDIHMPQMDGITYLRKLTERPQSPTVVMISSVSMEDAINALHCFELGAFDYIEKPQASNLLSDSEKIRQVMKAAVKQKKKGKRLKDVSKIPVVPIDQIGPSLFDLLLVGSSTGGVEALKILLESMPAQAPPLLIVQHIPGHFSGALARRLNDCCQMTVKEAVNGETVQANTAYIAPGGRHLKVEGGQGDLLRLRVTDDPALNHHRPSVDYLFASALALPKKWRMAGAILTGMGSDGAQQLKRMREAGHYTIAQDEESCVVYGMPKAAAEIGAAVSILPLTSIAYHLLRGAQSKARA